MLCVDLHFASARARRAPCSKSGRAALSATLAAVAATLWISLLRLSTATGAFVPKYHCWPLRV